MSTLAIRCLTLHPSKLKKEASGLKLTGNQYKWRSRATYRPPAKLKFNYRKISRLKMGVMLLTRMMMITTPKNRKLLRIESKVL